MNILAIESSCDETAAAVIEDGRTIRSSVVRSQVDMHALYGGVVPEIASRAHTESIYRVAESALCEAEMTLAQVDAFAVTYAPGLIGALLTGVSFAKGAAFASGKPLIPVHHIKGHVAANYLVHPELRPPFLALVVSGGHTSLYRVSSYTDYETIGQTRDDAAGEAFDKAARVLGLPYPGGAVMDRLAGEGDKNAYRFTVSSVDGARYDFSFSGLKTAVINLANNMKSRGEALTEDVKKDIAASFTKTLVETITSRLSPAMEDARGLPVVMAGGVAANSHLRSAVKDMCESHGTTLFVPPLSLCGDNAAMIGSQAFFDYQAGIAAPLNLNAYATKNVDF